jgi:pilus assembly protein CpaF
MKEQLEQPAALADIPMFAEYDEEPSPPTPAAGDGQPFGVYSAEELRSSRASLPAADLDWTQVVDLRRRASEIITDEAEEYARASGRPLAGEHPARGR